MTLTWQIVDEAAEALGAQLEARRKWRQRGLPAAWQMKIAQHLLAKGVMFSLGDFAKLPTTGRKA